LIRKNTTRTAKYTLIFNAATAILDKGSSLINCGKTQLIPETSS